MIRRLWILIVVPMLFVSCNGDGTDPPPPPPPTTTTIVQPPPPLDPRPYIQWTCHESKLTCKDRQSWAKDIFEAYTEWRGDRDLEYLLTRGWQYLKGGNSELVDLSPDELAIIVERMKRTHTRGARLGWRIENEQHRDFDPDPLGAWHRSQVRKDVAKEMIAELKAESAVYGEIASAFPDTAECDTIKCKIENLLVLSRGAQ